MSTGIDYEDKKSRKKLFKKIMEEKSNIIELRRKKTKKAKATMTIIRKKEIFTPEVSDEDNILIQLIKKLLKREKIILREKINCFNSPIELSNYKRQLLTIHTMSIERFSKWMEILGYDWKIVYQKKKNLD